MSGLLSSASGLFARQADCSAIGVFACFDENLDETCIDTQLMCCRNGEGCPIESHICWLNDRCCPIGETCEDAETHWEIYGGGLDPSDLGLCQYIA